MFPWIWYWMKTWGHFLRKRSTLLKFDVSVQQFILGHLPTHIIICCIHYILYIIIRWKLILFGVIKKIIYKHKNICKLLCVPYILSEGTKALCWSWSDVVSSRPSCISTRGLALPGRTWSCLLLSHPSDWRQVTVSVVHPHRDKYRFYACMLRARFDDNKEEKDMVKATMMLKSGEEEFWANQHPQPYIFPDSPGGTSYERYECYKVSQILLPSGYKLFLVYLSLIFQSDACNAHSLWVKNTYLNLTVFV